LASRSESAASGGGHFFRQVGRVTGDAQVRAAFDRMQAVIQAAGDTAVADAIKARLAA
jgi:hypothetical protein